MQMVIPYSIDLAAGVSEGMTYLQANGTGLPRPPASKAHPHQQPTFGPDGTIQVEWCAPDCDPEKLVTANGFFVQRVLPLNALQGSRIEVLHLSFNETTVSWFWPVKGTGVFLELDALRAHGALAELDARAQWNKTYGVEWATDEDAPIYMAAANVSAVLFRDTMAQAQDLYRPELVVRLPFVSDTQRMGPCPVPASMLSTGWATSRPCTCDASPELALTNCGAGSAGAHMLR